MLNIKDLKSEDVGRAVIYQGHPSAPKEEGIIKSWNDKYVFVEFDKPPKMGIATPPEKLILK